LPAEAKHAASAMGSTPAITAAAMQEIAAGLNAAAHLMASRPPHLSPGTSARFSNGVDAAEVRVAKTARRVAVENCMVVVVDVS